MATKKIYKNFTQNTYKVNAGGYSSTLPSNSIVENYRLKEQLYVKLNGSNEKVKKITTISYAKDGTGTATSVYKNASNNVISAPSESDWNSYTDKFIIETWTNGYLNGLLDDVIETGEITISDTAEYYNGNNSEIFPAKSRIEYTINNPNDSNITARIQISTDNGADVHIDYGNGESANISGYPGLTIQKEYPKGEYVLKISCTSLYKAGVFNYSWYSCLKHISVHGSSFTDAEDMFNVSKVAYHSGDRTLDLSEFDTSNVTTMRNMFSRSQFLSVDLSNFDTSQVTDMYGMFAYSKCSSIDLSNLDTSEVINMSRMFVDVECFTNLDLKHFNTSNVTDMSSMFSGMNEPGLNPSSGLKTLDISSFDFSKVTDANNMFSRNRRLTTITWPSTVDFSDAYYTTAGNNGLGSMFRFCTRLSSFSLRHWCTPTIEEQSTGFDENLGDGVSGTYDLPCWGMCPGDNHTGECPVVASGTGNIIATSIIKMAQSDAYTKFASSGLYGEHRQARADINGAFGHAYCISDMVSGTDNTRFQGGPMTTDQINLAFNTQGNPYMQLNSATGFYDFTYDSTVNLDLFPEFAGFHYTHGDTSTKPTWLQFVVKFKTAITIPEGSKIDVYFVPTNEKPNDVGLNDSGATNTSFNKASLRATTQSISSNFSHEFTTYGNGKFQKIADTGQFNINLGDNIVSTTHTGITALKFEGIYIGNSTRSDYNMKLQVFSIQTPSVV
jgi:surface protein